MTRNWISAISPLSDRWWQWCLMGLMETTVLLALVSLLWLGLRRRVSPQVGCVLFLLVPLKLLLPLEVAVPAGWLPSLVIIESKSREPKLNPSDRSVPSNAPLAVFEPAVADPPRVIAGTPPFSTEAAVEPASQVTETNAATVQTSRSSPVRSVELPTIATCLMFIWFMTVVILIVRFFWRQIRFWQFVRCLPRAEDPQLKQIVRELQQRIGIQRPVRTLVSDAIAVPSICGCFRPTLLLPANLKSLLSTEQLQWVLLHELAHIRRRDLLVVAMQRLMTILYWYNPAIWAANRVIHALREYACDDLAVTLCDGTSIDSGEALLQILKTANQGSRRLSGALGVFGLDPRASCAERLKRLLDTDRTVRTGLDRWSICALLLFAGLVLPRLHAADKPAEELKPSTVQKKAGSEGPQLAKSLGRFELLVVDSDQKPIPHAAVEIRTDPHLKEEHLLRGKFGRQVNYGTQFVTDETGQLAIKISDKVQWFQVFIDTPRYGPYCAEWSSENDSHQIPAQFTAELESAWSAGGVIVNPEGKPIEGVIVHPRVNYKKRPGDANQLGTGAELTTDQAGRWRFDMIPKSDAHLFVEINHPQFRPIRQSLPRDGYGIDFDQQPSRQIVLDPGLSVRGRVTDDAGQPIAGALIRSKFMNDIRSATTDKDGHYQLHGCEEKLSRIVVSAKGKATDMQEVRINPDLEAVDFVMKAGGKVRIRVVDEQDRPLPKSRIFFQRWRGVMFQYFEFDHVDQYCDEKGVWEWNEAPLDGFYADICPPQGMQLTSQSLIPRDEEYVFKPPTALVVTGRVIDAVTREPIKKFAVIPGVRYENGMPAWEDNGRFAASDGKFQLKRTDGRDAYFVRIEASGYRTVTSRDIKFSEGATQLDFELVKGADVVATIINPSGSPAAGAKVALGINGAQIMVKNGEFGLNTSCEILTSDEQGQVRFPEQDQPYHLVVLHSAGCAHLVADVDAKQPKIQLQAWGVIRGNYRVGSKATSDAPIVIDNIGPHVYEPNGARIFTSHSATTDANGDYLMDRVWPGRGWVGREIIMMVREGAIEVTSSVKKPVSIEPGDKLRIDFGGEGRPVVGKLESSDPKTKFDWKQLVLHVETRRATLPPVTAIPVPANIANDPKQRVDWIREWQKTDAGKAWQALQAAHQVQDQERQKSTFYRGTLTDQGEFRIDNVPEGDYVMTLLFHQGSFPFTVPEMKQPQSDEELDLGVLVVK